MLRHRDVDGTDDLGEPVVEHRPGAVGGLFGWLEHRSQTARPLLTCLCEQRGGPSQASNVDVVATACIAGTTASPSRAVAVLAHGRSV